LPERERSIQTNEIRASKAQTKFTWAGQFKWQFFKEEEFPAARRTPAKT
jgi:hypothetical protein